MLDKTVAAIVKRGRHAVTIVKRGRHAVTIAKLAALRESAPNDLRALLIVTRLALAVMPHGNRLGAWKIAANAELTE